MIIPLISYRPLIAVVIAIFIFVGGIIFLGNPLAPAPAPGNTTVFLIYTGSGTVLQLLDSGQIDGFFLWESVPQTAVLGNIGRIIATQDDLPPSHKWAEEPCCVLVMHQDLIEKHPDVAAMLSALTTAGIEYINENKSSAAEETAEWLYGKKKIIIGDASLDPVVVETTSFRELRFISGQNLSFRSDVTPEVVYHGLEILNRTESVTTGLEPVDIDLGYLSTDHHAPLFVLLDNWQYFRDRYGIALVPSIPDVGRSSDASLEYGNRTIARVHLLPGQSGGGLMTGIGQGVIDAIYVGSVPAEVQISLGNPARIIQPIQSGGSALVVGMNASCTDWSSFIRWAQERSSSGRPLVLATVQTSIQEKMLRGALQEEGIDVRLLQL